MIRAVCGPWPSEGVPGRRPDTAAAIGELLEVLKCPGACSRLAISAGLKTPYLCLTARISDPASGELGLEGDLLTFSGIDVPGLKVSNCLEYLLLAVGVGIVRFPELGGRGEPDEDGVNERGFSRPAKES